VNKNIAVIGLGKLGLPLAVLIAKAGHKVFAFDQSLDLMSKLRDDSFRSSEPGLMSLLSSAKDQMVFCHDLNQATETVEVIFVIVPTPSSDDGYFSNEAILKVIDGFNPSHFADRTTVIDIVSTVMPGSCDGAIREKIENRLGQKIGFKVGLCYNPEFIALGSVIKNMQEPDMHLLGESDAWAGDLIEEVLASVATVKVPCQRMNLKEAELVKIAVNNFVTMKISYANTLYQASILLGDIDIDIVTKAIGLDTRIGTKYLKGAAPYGGPCFPRDTRALTALYNEIGVPSHLSNATEIVNKSHVQFVTQFIQKQILNHQVIGIVGLSYKKGTPVIEESPGVLISLDLIKNGFELIIWDDENALLPGDFANDAKYYQDLEGMVEKADFVLVTRPIDGMESLSKILNVKQKPFLDLWRQIQ
jgi:UDPglucose 6-dehydrogenase